MPNKSINRKNSKGIDKARQKTNNQITKYLREKNSSLEKYF